MCHIIQDPDEVDLLLMTQRASKVAPRSLRLEMTIDPTDSSNELVQSVLVSVNELYQSFCGNTLEFDIKLLDNGLIKAKATVFVTGD